MGLHGLSGKVTQHNAANAEESASVSEELSSQAESMNDIVVGLVSLVGGTGQGVKSKESRKQGKDRSLSQTDRMYHRVA